MDSRSFRSAIRSVLLTLVVLGGQLGPGTAAATMLFTVDSGASSLTVVSASFVNSPAGTFPTTIEPVAGSDFFRSLGGSLFADEVTGVMESGDFLLLGDDLVGDQIMIDRRGNGRDTGDVALMSMGIDIDALGDAVFNAGFIDFDLSLGSFRVSSPAPLSLLGVSSSTINTAGPGMITEVGGRLELDIPLDLSFDQITVIDGGVLSLQLVGSIHATAVPEPSTALLVVTGIVGLALRSRREHQ